MKSAILRSLRSLRAQYWLIPASMALGAMIVALAVVTLDRHLSADWMAQVPWIYANGPTGARDLLSTIAGSMITVAGVTFSITIAALATTAATFGPRLITNFMQDRGNQITLGTFIATFLFCLLVLRTVRTSGDPLPSFVPHAAIIVALLLALANLGVLIYFIHHIPESIMISNLVAQLGRGLNAHVDKMYPDTLGEPAHLADPVKADLPEFLTGRAAMVRAGADGYVQYVDAADLMALAGKHDLLVEMRHRPGDFVSAADVVARVTSRAEVRPEALEAVHRAVVIGGYRSEQQDLLYLVNRLVEVAARALSPGMNDIFTATNAIDWLASGLCNLAGREIPEGARRDDEGQLRVITRPLTFEEVAEGIFDQLRPYVASDRNAAIHMMRTLTGMAHRITSDRRRAVLLAHANALRHAALEALEHPRDVEAIEAAHADRLEG